MPLNCLTDEILDSMLSLRRFTSLVRWQYVKDSFRPVRSTSSTQDIVLLDQQYQAIPRYSIDGWLWTAASDGTFTVGWIVHDYDYDGRPEWDYTANPASERPYLRVAGLSTADGDLELVWYDDRRGTIIKRESPFQATTYTVQLPETEGTGNGFGKSVAFLIQPVGYTPDREFAELPNELVGQINIVELEGTGNWHEERPTVQGTPPTPSPTYTFEARTRPEISPGERSNYHYYWHFGQYGWFGGSHTASGYSVSGVTFQGVSGEVVHSKVTLDIEDSEGNRVSGDIVYARVE